MGNLDGDSCHYRHQPGTVQEAPTLASCLSWCQPVSPWSSSHATAPAFPAYHAVVQYAAALWRHHHGQFQSVSSPRPPDPPAASQAAAPPAAEVLAWPPPTLVAFRTCHFSAKNYVSKAYSCPFLKQYFFSGEFEQKTEPSTTDAPGVHPPAPVHPQPTPATGRP